ncbi:MAG: PEP-CTERM sorting domain-containing protein [Pirellulaceae bacterium]
MPLAAVTVLNIHCLAQDQACGLPVPGRLFCDDFNDGSISDGIPGTWLPGASPGGLRDASSGDFVVTHSASMSTYVQELNGVRDLSIRTKFNLPNTSRGGADELNLWARSPLPPAVDDPAAYVGGINVDGVIYIVYFSGDRVSTVLRSASTSIDPVNNDVFLQFDIFGNELSLTAWQDGSAKPSSPQLVARDNRLREGGQVGFSFSPMGGTDSATLRYFEVVPEPSSILLLGLSLTVFTVRRRRGQL